MLITEDRVVETTSSTGTGAVNLLGAVTGFRSFNAVMNDGDTCYYMIEAVDSSGVPTGQWESGLGTYNATGDTLSRTNVSRSSNSNNPVSFTTGTKRIYLAMIAQALRPLSIEPVAGTTYTFVATDAGKHKRFTSATDVTVTVPADVFEPGDRIRMTAAGTGVVTLVEDTGVALNSRDNALASAGQMAVFEIECVAANEFDVLGDVA